MIIKPKHKFSLLLATLILAANMAVQAETAASKPKVMGTSEFVFKYLVAEVASQRNDLGLASSLFYDLAQSTRNPRLAERAAKTAVVGNQPQIAIEAVDLWAELDPKSAEAQQASTQMLISTGRLLEAKPFIQKLLEKEDTRGNGFLYLSTLLARQSNKQNVYELVRDLADPYPALPEAHFALAHAAWSAGKNDVALAELDQANKLKPGWEVAANLKGQVLYGQSPEAAIEFYRDFLAQYPQSNDVRLTLARLLVNQKRFTEAKPEFIKLAKTADSNPEILVVVGLLSLQSDELSEAERYFKQALDAGFKDSDQVYLYLGQLAERQKNDTQAQVYYGKVKPGERLLEAKFASANVTSRTKGVDAAVKELDALQELNSEQSALVIQAEAGMLTRAKRNQEAYDLLDKAVNNLPNTPDIIYDYAMAADRLGKVDVTERELRKLILLKPDYAPAYNALGYSLADRNLKLDEAQNLIARALELSPNDHYILDSMGWVQYRLGKLDQAADYLRRAYSAQTDPEIAAHLGEVLWQQGKYDEARKTWETALQEFPDNEVLLTTHKKFAP